jgi:hypothetical protein
MPLLTWQLWLGREIVTDRPLPWHKPLPVESMTPGRVAQSFARRGRVREKEAGTSCDRS